MVLETFLMKGQKVETLTLLNFIITIVFYKQKLNELIYK